MAHTGAAGAVAGKRGGSRCISIAGKTGQRCGAPARWGNRCVYHTRWTPPLLVMGVTVTKTKGSGKCACCVQKIGPHECWTP